ncbi:MAG TPA: hypothetical protein VLQ89_01670 [Candidatus Binatia bacterium]|nr:hypothetical protein [Candidatus Binatia bacterium]
MKRTPPWFLIVLVTLPLLAYLPTLRHELIWDAKPMITENDLLQGHFSLLAPFRTGYWAPTSQRGSGYDYYRPLMVLTFMAEKAVWGLDPFRLRLVNLFIFIAGLLVLYALLSRMAAGSGAAEAAVLLFALFPLHLDNITWVVGRCDLLMFFFGLLALYWIDRYLDGNQIRFAALAMASYALALFSKEAAMFLLPLLALHEWTRRRRLTVSLHAVAIFITLSYWGIKSTVIGRGGIPIRFFSGLWENGRILLGVLGYYLRTLAYPFRYDMFLPADDVQTAGYQAAGAGFLLLLALLCWLGRKKILFLQAWIWIVPFLAGHLLMVFTPIYPFSISSRYLLFPAVGLAWLLAHGLRKLPGRTGTIVLVALLFSQAAAIIANGQKYRSEKTFWLSALAASPGDSFLLSQTAGQLRQEGDFQRSEALLRRALAGPMKNSTAVAVALQLADITRVQARYEESLEWLEKMRSLALDVSQGTLRLTQLLQIHRARGDLAAANQALRDMVALLPAAQVREMHIELALAFAAWEEASAAARTLAAAERGAWLARIDRTQAAFRSMPPRARADFFVGRGSFMCAWLAWPKETTAAFPEQLQLARLAFLAGEEREGRRRADILAQEGKNDFRMLNSLGNLFFDLQRADQALPFYRRSLQLNDRQPVLARRLAQLESGSER